MNKLSQLWRGFFDIRPGERLRVLFMFGYLLFVLFAYYILKPLSRALFLNKFDIDKLPWLYVLIAAVGGVLAYLYTKLAVRASLSRAVFWATVFSVGCLVALWAALKNPSDWLYYVFNIWVSLFSIILVSQGWLVAANVFNPREAKRVYGVLGVGAVIGAAFGGSFTAAATQVVGIHNLLLASAFMVLLAYGCFLAVMRQPGVRLGQAKAAGEEEADFHFSEIVRAIQSFRHLQVIIGVITLTYIVDVMVEYQFSAMAKAAYTSKEELTAFLGSFYGLYLNLITFVLQFFLTAAVVSAFGVGGTLQIMPVSISIASLATFFFPSVLSTAAARLAEASTRYSFNRTGMELLYLPLPADLKNRTKAFVDIFVDRFARGLGGMLLVIVGMFNLDANEISLLVIAFCAAWIVLSARAKNEYIATVRKRLESRRLDLENVRISVSDPATIQLLTETARSRIPRQACYALGLLQEVGDGHVRKLVEELANSTSDEVRAKVFELGLKANVATLTEEAQRELRSWRGGQRSPAIGAAVTYLLTFGSETPKVARRLLEHPNEQVQDQVLQFLADHRGLAAEMLPAEWLDNAKRSQNPQERRLAALAIRALGSTHSAELIELLRDSNLSVVEAALQTAGALQSREFIAPMVERIHDPRIRAAVIDSLRAYGPRICGTLGDLLVDRSTSQACRRHIARVLQGIPHQRSVDALLQAIGETDLNLRATVLRALHRLREEHPKLNYGSENVQQQILKEARMYYEMNAALMPFRENGGDRKPVALLSKTLDERLKKTIERLFYLLGLRYPLREVHAAYLAMNRGGAEDISTAIEFLDNVLERELKRILLPLFDAPEFLAERGKEVFGIERLTVTTALRKILETGDEWLVCCAISVAAQLKLQALAPEIAKLQTGAGVEVERVARDAAAQLAQ